MKAVIHIIINICRLLLAGTFIFSGYVKAIDPLGTQYKINDYLAAVHLAGVVPDWITLTASIGISALEFSLGIFLLFAIQRRLTSKLVLGFMGVMTFITLWIAIENPVKDCGCFGDAIQLSNTQTLLKNIVLLISAGVVAYRPLMMLRFVSKSNQWIVTNYTLVFIVVSSVICLYNLPMFDFRPYHIGADIRKGMEIPKDAPQPKYETTFIMSKGGVTKEFTLDNYPDSTWTFVDSKTVQTEAGYVPPIHDFSIQDITTGEDFTEQILARKGYTFLLISPHLEQADDSNFGGIDRIYEYAKQEKIPLLCLTASNEKAIKRWQDLTGAEYSFYRTDETTLKTIIRSNPGLVLLKNGVVVNKWSHNYLPKEEELRAPMEELKIGHVESDSIAGKITRIVLWFALPLILLTLADRLWAWTKWMKKKRRRNRIYQLLNKKKEHEKENCSR
ncbi:DoxX family protein [Hoylesella saccharolytica F0055]|uniref:DoxX family protein n=1 Tax=Hoylesella saccharolytica F0055 TaxID=1127699 RepID=L1NI06_9BACT|nr:DoxX family protein [Hoylesella saccharolytica F0055]